MTCRYRSDWHAIAYITTVADAEYKSEFGPTIYTSNTSPYESYGVYFVSIWEKFDRVIMALHSILKNKKI